MSGEDIANMLSAAMSGEDTKSYEGRLKSLYNQIDYLKEQIDKQKIENLADYADAWKLKGVTNELFCFAVNNGLDYKAVGEVDRALFDKMYKFVKNYNKIKDPEVRAVAKYFVTNWQYYYSDEDLDKMIQLLFNHDKLRAGKYGYLVIGLHYSVGDNVFGETRDGKMYRLSQRVCVFQAFPVKDRIAKRITQLDLDIPQLERFYHITDVDYKECAKIYLNRKQHNMIRRNYCRC